jgi:hypothetical protein
MDSMTTSGNLRASSSQSDERTDAFSPSKRCNEKSLIDESVSTTLPDINGSNPADDAVGDCGRSNREGCRPLHTSGLDSADDVVAADDDLLYPGDKLISTSLSLIGSSGSGSVLGRMERDISCSRGRMIERS